MREIERMNADLALDANALEGADLALMKKELEELSAEIREDGEHLEPSKQGNLEFMMKHGGQVERIKHLKQQLKWRAKGGNPRNLIKQLRKEEERGAGVGLGPRPVSLWRHGLRVVKRLLIAVIPFRIEFGMPMTSRQRSKHSIVNYFSALSLCSILQFALYSVAALWFTFARLDKIGQIQSTALFTESLDALDRPFEVYFSQETVALKLRLDFAREEVEEHMRLIGSSLSAEEYLCAHVLVTFNNEYSELLPGSEQWSSSFRRHALDCSLDSAFEEYARENFALEVYSVVFKLPEEDKVQRYILSKQAGEGDMNLRITLPTRSQTASSRNNLLVSFVNDLTLGAEGPSAGAPSFLDLRVLRFRILNQNSEGGRGLQRDYLFNLEAHNVLMETSSSFFISNQSLGVVDREYFGGQGERFKSVRLDCFIAKTEELGIWPSYPESMTVNSSLFSILEAVDPFHPNVMESNQLKFKAMGQRDIRVVAASRAVPVNSVQFELHLDIDSDIQVTQNHYYTILGFLTEVGGFVYLLALFHSIYWTSLGVGRGQAYREYSSFMTDRIYREMSESLQLREQRLQELREQRQKLLRVYFLQNGAEQASPAPPEEEVLGRDKEFQRRLREEEAVFEIGEPLQGLMERLQERHGRCNERGLRLEMTKYRRELLAKREIQTEFSQKVSAQGIFYLHLHVEFLQRQLQELRAQLEQSGERSQAVKQAK